jgi:Abnormal spindle-like microcephaly-assoc'd, ASPM-SPD-2-Hydin
MQGLSSRSKGIDLSKNRSSQAPSVLSPIPGSGCHYRRPMTILLLLSCCFPFPLRAAGVPELSALSCYTSTPPSGSGTDICTVKVNMVARSNGQTVSLSSNNAAVTLPASVIVPANTTSLQFTANISSVSTAQSTTLTANAGGVSMSVNLTLTPALPTLSISSTNIQFDNVAVNSAGTQTATLTSTGNEPLTIHGATVTGSGFALSGATFPVTLNPGQIATLSIKFNPTTLGMTTGQLIITSNSSTGGTAVISLTGAGTASQSFSYTGSNLVSSLVPPSPAAPVPSDFFGMAIFNLAPNSLEAQPNVTPFPAFPVSTLHLGPAVPWPLVEPSKGQFNWTKMDNSIGIAQKSGVNDFIYNFTRSPLWASTSPTAPCTNGPGAGSCAPPNLADFDDFVTHVVQRYCGTIRNYEPWNEPDNPQFWDGTNAQMLAIVQHVYQIAKDPANCGCTNGSCSPNGGVNPNKVLMLPISGLNPVQVEWLDSYLADAGTPYPYADITAFHGYVWSGYQPEQIVTGMQLFRQTLAKYGLSNLELWNTEVSWEWNTNLNMQQQASWLMRYHMTQEALGVSRVVWFAYDNCTWGTLWSSPLCATNQGPTGQLTEAGNAYSTIEAWLTGANLTQCQRYQNGLWACELQRPGNYEAWMLWSSTGANISVPVPASFGLTVYRDATNTVYALPTQLTVSEMPVLLESQDL